MFHVKSTLGSYVAANQEDWQRTSERAATFPSRAAADNWIVHNFGRNGLKFFYPVPVRSFDGEDGDVA